MLTLYLDNSVYHHMHKGYDRAGELRELVDRGTGCSGVTVVMSMENLSELIPLVLTDTRQFSEKIQLLRSIVDWDRPLKRLRLLLEEDIRSFARYGRGTTPFAGTGTTMRKLTKHALRALDTPTEQDIMELSEIGDEYTAQKTAFKNGMDQAREPVLAAVKSSGIGFPDLQDMWEYCLRHHEIVEPLLELHAKEAGSLKQCRERGLLNMMDLPSIRMSVGYDLGFIYWMAFEQRETSRRDPGDQHHAIYSSAADVFVCADGFLRKILAPIPDRPIEILDIGPTIERLERL